jgi:hypothetical protein
VIGKRKIELKSGYCADGITYCITICNAILMEDSFTKINNIIKCFVKGNQMFFGFFRTDGINLTKEEWKKCDEEIPIFFERNGEYKEIVVNEIDRKGNLKKYKGYLTVAKATIDEQLYNEMQWIFQYYLETTFFSPKISFSEFETIYSKYMKQSTKNYIVNDYTDFLFGFSDSSDFSVTFDPKRYNISQVCEAIKKIIN